ncbi:hypothetical protein IMZ48_27725 [Candidatus Bathyarchaeota archaeon]|nr:hypothetical protein [Candidatus Bathyarchaeota archaeon]
MPPLPSGPTKDGWSFPIHFHPGPHFLTPQLSYSIPPWTLHRRISTNTSHQAEPTTRGTSLLRRSKASRAPGAHQPTKAKSGS